MWRRFHHQCTQTRLRDDATAGDAEFGVAAEELRITGAEEAVEAGGAACRRALIEGWRKGGAAVAAGRFERSVGHENSLRCRHLSLPDARPKRRNRSAHPHRVAAG